MIYNLINLLNLNNIQGSYSFQHDSMWLYCYPKQLKMLNQGWKIHISCYLHDFKKVLTKIMPIIIKYHCFFKVPIREHAFLSLLYGDKPYEETGKIITIYPSQSNQLEKILNELYFAMPNIKYSKIPTDYSFKNSNIFIRYGAFSDKLSYLDDTGIIHSAIKDDKNKPVIDERKVGRYCPKFINLPNFLPKNNVEYNLDLTSIGITNPILLSRKPGCSVYEIKYNHKPAIMKLAFKNSVLDFMSRDGISRLQNEISFLTKFKKLAYIPDLYFSLTNDQICLVIEEKCSGISLDRIFDASEYNHLLTTQNKRKIIKKISLQLRKIHQMGIILRDFAPNNIMINSNQQIKFIDFENTAMIGEKFPFSGATPGYFNTHDVKRNTYAADIYGLGAIIFFLNTSFLPYFKECFESKKALKNKLMTVALKTNPSDLKLTLIGIDLMINTPKTLYKNILSLKKIKTDEIFTQDISFNTIKNTKKYLKNRIQQMDFNNKHRLLKPGLFDLNTSYLSINFGIIGLLFLIKEYTVKTKSDEFLTTFDKIINWININYKNQIHCSNLINGEISLLDLINWRYKSEYKNLKLKILRIIKQSKIKDTSLFTGLAGQILTLSKAYSQESDKRLKRIEKDILKQKFVIFIQNYTFNKDLSLSTGLAGVCLAIHSYPLLNKLHKERYLNNMLNIGLKSIDNDHINLYDKAIFLSNFVNNESIFKKTYELLVKINNYCIYQSPGLLDGLSLLLLLASKLRNSELVTKYSCIIFTLSNSKNGINLWPFPYQAIPNDYSFLNGTTGIYYALLKSNY